MDPSLTRHNEMKCDLASHNQYGVMQGVGMSMTLAAVAAMSCPQFRSCSKFVKATALGLIGGIVIHAVFADKQKFQETSMLFKYMK